MEKELTSEDFAGDWIDGGGYGIGGPARLSALRDNGGPTLSLLPLPDSPAIDAGDPTEVVADARGLSRSAGAAPDAATGGRCRWKTRVGISSFGG